MSDHPSQLRTFQAQVSHAAANYPAQAQTWVALRAAGQGWLVSAAEMSEALVAPAVSAIGAMPADILGIVATRGKVFSVLDMPHLLAGAPRANGEANGWLVAISPDFMSGVALWWPELVGMRPSTEFLSSHDLRAPLSREVLVDETGERWQVLDVRALLDKISAATAPKSTDHSREVA